MGAIFSDFVIEAIEQDPIEPGVFIKARKPALFVQKSLEDHELFSIIVHRRRKDIEQFWIAVRWVGLSLQRGYRGFSSRAAQTALKVRRHLSRRLPDKVKAAIRRLVPGR
jgi:hypothetical protein